MASSYRLALGCLVFCAACSRAPVTANLGAFVVRVEPDDARFVVSRSDGTVLLEGLPADGSTDGKTPIGTAFRNVTADVQEQYGSFLFTEPTTSWTIASGFSNIKSDTSQVSFDIDGVDGGNGSITVGQDGIVHIVLDAPNTTRASLALKAADGEHYLGLGAHTQDVDHRGWSSAAWVSEQGVGQTDDDASPAAWFLEGSRHQTYFPDPFLLSSFGYGIEVEGTQRSLYTMASERADLLRVESWDRSIALTLYDGPTMPAVLEHRGAVVGRAPVPPAWAFAPWIDAIYGSTNVRRIAQVLHDNAIPASALWSEDWSGGKLDTPLYQITGWWTPDPTLYGDLQTLTGELHGQGLRFLAYFNSFMTSTHPQFAEASQKGYLIHRADGSVYTFSSTDPDPTSLVDLTNPDARTWMQGYLDATLALGVDGWMADFGEWLPVDAKLASGEDPFLVHNRYPLDWQHLNEAAMNARPNADQLLTFVRSGFTGSSGVAHQVVWGGDQRLDFDSGDGLPSVVPLAIGFGLSGLPYFGSDISGYTNIDGSPPSTKELFFRWTELGAFSVLMRTHHGRFAMENWRFDTDADTLSHFGRWARVHTRLYPYLLALSQRAAQTSLPILRLLALEFPQDEEAYTNDSEMIVGSSLLVAPVSIEGATSRDVFLPSARWIPISFADDGRPTSNAAAITGPMHTTATAAVEQIPVYARAGAVIPLLGAGIQTLAPVDDAAGVMGLSQLASSRSVLVALGATDATLGNATDDLGITYALAPAAAPGSAPTYKWNGALLASCDTTMAPCVTSTAANEGRLALLGGGTLEIVDGGNSVSKLTVSTRAADAPLEAVIVW